MAGEERDDLVDDTPEDQGPPNDPADDDLDDDLPPPDDDGGSDDSDDEGEQRRAAPPSKDKGTKPPVTPPSQQQPKTVPLATFLQEKNKFTEALEAERAERKKIQEQLEKLLNPPKAPPKFADDPEGYINHATKQSAQELLAKLDEHGKKITEVVDTTKQTAEQRAEQQFMEELGSTEQVFAKQVPDYYDALNHVRRIAYQQLKVFHPEAEDEQLMKVIMKQELDLAKNAAKAGRNPHELAYQLALANGYVKKAPGKGGKEGKPGKKSMIPPPSFAADEDTMDPDFTLGRSNGEAPDDDADAVPDPDKIDPFEDALQEVFGKPRKRA